MGFQEAPCANPVADVEPIRPDHDEDDVASANLGRDHFAKIAPERDVMNVHEDVLAPELLDQAVSDPSGPIGDIRRRVPIADEDAWNSPGGLLGASCLALAP